MWRREKNKEAWTSCCSLSRTLKAFPVENKWDEEIQFSALNNPGYCFKDKNYWKLGIAYPGQLKFRLK